MPPLQYKLIHSARAQRRRATRLEDAMRKAYAADPPPVRRGV